MMAKPWRTLCWLPESSHFAYPRGKMSRGGISAGWGCPLWFRARFDATRSQSSAPKWPGNPAWWVENEATTLRALADYRTEVSWSLPAEVTESGPYPTRRDIMKTQRLYSYPLVVIITFIIGILAASGANAEANSNQKILNELLARIQIQEIISNNIFLYDNKDSSFADLYTEDMVWEARRVGTTSSLLYFNSRESFREFARNRWKTTTANLQGRHFLTDQVFLKLTDTYAHVRTLVLIVYMRNTEPMPSISRMGILEDELRKTSDGWRISHRIFQFDN